jgi:glutathione synthase/RimK-type ligase-like ATP-grasp enzyme
MCAPELHVHERLPTELPHAVELIREAAETLGLSFRSLDPDFGHLFELSDGRVTRTLLGGRSPLNDAVSARLAEDKYYTELVLRRAGYRVPESVRCLKPGQFVLEDYSGRDGTAGAEAFAAARGFPLVVKPNRLSHGRQVQLVHNADELLSAIHRVWNFDYLALVQTAIGGVDIRLDFLDSEYLVGYTRRAPSGASPQEIRILNLARGAQADVLDSIPEAWHEHCLRIGRALHLRFFGIDFKASGLDADPKSATVIEVNASPLFVQMALQGHRERARRAQARVLEAVWSQA